jgi:hypothetical protein
LNRVFRSETGDQFSLWFANLQPGTCNLELETHPQPATHNPQPATLNPQPATRNPQPATRNPQLATRNPQPLTRNPQLATRNSQPASPNSGTVFAFSCLNLQNHRCQKWGFDRSFFPKNESFSAVHYRQENLSVAYAEF